MSMTMTPKLKQPNLVVLNGIVERVEPVNPREAQRWGLFNYKLGAVFLYVETDRDVYGGHHPILVPSIQAAEMAATHHHCASQQIPLPVTVMGWLYSKGEQSLTIASHVFCHISSQEKESIDQMLLTYGVAPSA